MSDAEMMALLGIAPGRSPQQEMFRPIPAGRRKRHNRTVTAAVARGSLLAIATLEYDGTALRLCPEVAGYHELSGREQSDTVSISRDVARHLAAARVRRIVLRIAPDKGPYVAMGTVHRLEAILQLIPDLTVEVVHTQKVGGWVRSKGIALPVPQVTGARYIAAQQSAIETAAYGLLGE